MSGLSFSLAPHTCLENSGDCYYIYSKVPIRILKLNQPLFKILKQIQEQHEFSRIIIQHPEIKAGQLLRTFLMLTARGYLQVVGLGEPDEYSLISVIVPVKDQLQDLIECLQSLSQLDYPQDKLEIIVVDDGSEKDVAGAISSFKTKLLREEKSQGPAAARNLGAQYSSGEILAFLDADCIADKNWLREIVPFFKPEKVGAVGGFVDGYYRQGLLDRYEEVYSSLNMGKRVLFQHEKDSNFYVPSCNLLVARQTFLTVGGFDGDMQIGEDVDFCWRMRDLGYDLLYIPYGKVSHKHRNRLLKMLKRRQTYGTSEAALYISHRDKRKKFPIPLLAGLSLLAWLAAILNLNPYPLAAVPLFFGIDFWLKSNTLKRNQLQISKWKVNSSTLRSYLSFYYLAGFHLVRYYFILLIGLGFLWHPLWIFGGLTLLLTSIVDFQVKKPRLLYPVFLCYYTLDHLAYQTGVFWGCLKRLQFKSYLPVFTRT